MSCIDDLDDASEVSAYSSSDIGKSQSPIDIKSQETVAQQFPHFELSPDHQHEVNFTLKNKGYQVSVVLPQGSESENKTDLSFTGGGLNGKFNFVNFHIHWGTSDRNGSEHAVEGQTLPAEAHFVYKNLETQEIAVIGFFLDTVHSADNENSEWKKYMHLGSEIKKGDTMDSSFNLSELIQIEGKHFVRYMGSLTTPPYTEGIIWTVFLDSVPILDEDLNLLRNNVMEKTYRELQPINDRVIYKNYDD